MKEDREFYITLEDICLKYKRLKSLISIIQTYTAECTEVTGVPEGAVSDALFEIEHGMKDTNEAFEDIINTMLKTSNCAERESNI